MPITRVFVCWGCLTLAPVGASGCSAEPASGGPRFLGGAPGLEAIGGASNDAEGGGVANVEASAAAAVGGASPTVRNGAESGASASVQGGAGAANAGGANAGGANAGGANASAAGAADAGAAGAGVKGSVDDCDLDAFARDFTRALANSTAPSGCAIAIKGAPIGKDRPVSAAALEFVASTRAESPDALAFMLESCDTPRTADCANVFDKYAGAAGGNLQILAHPFSDTIERCSADVELSVWSVTKDGTTSGTTYCLMGDRAGQAMGYCVFDGAFCAAQRH